VFAKQYSVQEATVPACVDLPLLSYFSTSDQEVEQKKQRYSFLSTVTVVRHLSSSFPNNEARLAPPSQDCLDQFARLFIEAKSASKLLTNLYGSTNSHKIRGNEQEYINNGSVVFYICV
jgi:hypothetical protein